MSRMSLSSYGSEVEHFLGKEEVEGSIPSMSSRKIYKKFWPKLLTKS